MENIKAQYGEEDLKEFKEIILKKITRAQEDLDILNSAYKNDSTNGTDDTSPTFKAFEEGAATMAKEANVQLGHPSRKIHSRPQKRFVAY
jgi:hypothetical protein